jgi:clan AA aspartic protease
MGLTYTDATIESLDGGGKALTTRFLVDTGAIDCLMPASLLQQAGVQPEGRALYELADGQTCELAFGHARIHFMETLAIAKIVFGPEGAEPLLGVIALEDAGVIVEPATHSLKRQVLRSLKKVHPMLREQAVL